MLFFSDVDSHIGRRYCWHTHFAAIRCRLRRFMPRADAATLPLATPLLRLLLLLLAAFVAMIAAIIADMPCHADVSIHIRHCLYDLDYVDTAVGGRQSISMKDIG